MPGLVRAFVAVAVGAPPLVAALRRAQDSLRQVGGITWVKPERFHFTLRFLGEIPAARVDAAREAVRSLAGRGGFDVEMAGLGTFPPERPARVVWAGCTAGGDALVSLALAAEAALVAAGFPREDRPFSPHLTLGRVKDPRAGREAARRASGGAPFSFGTLAVREVVLMKSVLGSAGPDYTPLETARL